MHTDKSDSWRKNHLVRHVHQKGNLTVKGKWSSSAKCFVFNILFNTCHIIDDTHGAQWLYSSAWQNSYHCPQFPSTAIFVKVGLPVNPIPCSCLLPSTPLLVMLMAVAIAGILASLLIRRPDASLLPPKLQRRGLVFERKLVTMEREWWVTMIVH